jgi:FkbM family methyltransferase
MSSFVRSLKNNLRGQLRKRGIYLFAEGSLPGNVDLQADMARIRPAETFETVLDVGANEGQSAQSFLSTYGGARVVSFEPIATTFEKLRVAVGNHPRATCENLAVGNHNGELEMQVGENSLVSRIVDPGEKAGRGAVFQKVRSVRLEDYLAEKRIDQIDLLKTDTEGHDLDVLRGCDSLLKSGRISFVLSEIGFSTSARDNSPIGPIYDYLKERDYALIGLYDPREWTHTRDISWMDALFVHRKELTATR